MHKNKLTCDVYFKDLIMLTYIGVVFDLTYTKYEILPSLRLDIGAFGHHNPRRRPTIAESAGRTQISSLSLYGKILWYLQ